MKWSAAQGAVVFATLLGACHPVRIGAGRNGADRPVQVSSALTCPLAQGDLTRVAVAADMRECTYQGPGARHVVVRLLPLDGRSPSDALRGVEASLQMLMAPDAPPSSVDPKRRAGDGRVVLNLPGVHIEADDDGAHVRALGEHIDAQSGEATIGGSWNGVANRIDARNDHVEVRVGFSGRQSADLTLLMQSDHPGPSGDRLVGYVARGPVTGPLVVSTIEAAQGDGRRHDVDLRDLKALVAFNVKP